MSDINFSRVVIDEETSHPISPNIESFSTYSGKVTPLLSWKDTYVHVGLDGNGTAIWISGIGLVLQTEDPPAVYYTNGLVKRVSEGKVFFSDGTVLKLGDSIQQPKVGSRITVKIDIQTHRIKELIEISPPVPTPSR